MTEALAELLVSEIDVQNVTVRPFEGFIFLCGGPHESSDGLLASMRHYALGRAASQDKQLAGRTVILAEELTILLHGGDFEDLIQFEEHIAALSACVMIFLESPGSIAELGSFSMMADLLPKLLVVCEQSFDSTKKPSFIFLGPIASLRRNRKDSVQVFPLLAPAASENEQRKVSRELLDDCWEYIEEEITKSIRSPIKEAVLDGASLPHQMILIVALASLYVGLRFGELESCLAALGSPVKGRALRRQLRMLEQVELIHRRTYGHEEFYFSLNDSQLLVLRPRDPERIVFDQSRFKHSSVRFYETADDRKRKAIKSFMKERGRV